MRLAFCFAKPDEIREGIARLAEVLADRMEIYRAFVDAGALPPEGEPRVVGDPGPRTTEVSP